MQSLMTSYLISVYLFVGLVFFFGWKNAVQNERLNRKQEVIYGLIILAAAPIFVPLVVVLQFIDHTKEN